MQFFCDLFPWEPFTGSPLEVTKPDSQHNENTTKVFPLFLILNRVKRGEYWRNQLINWLNESFFLPKYELIWGLLDSLTCQSTLTIISSDLIFNMMRIMRVPQVWYLVQKSFTWHVTYNYLLNLNVLSPTVIFSLCELTL